MPLPLLLLGAGKFLRALPLSAYLAIGVVGFIGIREWQHSRAVDRLEQDVAAMTSQRDAELRGKLEYQAALSDVTANRDALAQDIRRQNDAIAKLQTDLQATERAASLAAVRALQKGRESAEALRHPTSTVLPGHAALNDWLAERVK